MRGASPSKRGVVHVRVRQLQDCGSSTVTFMGGEGMPVCVCVCACACVCVYVCVGVHACGISVPITHLQE